MAEPRIARWSLASVLLVWVLVSSAGSWAQEMAAKGIFHGRGVVKAVAPGTGALTLAHDDIRGFMPAMEMMYRVQAPDVSMDLKPGDTIDFTIDATKYIILDVKLVSRAQ